MLGGVEDGPERGEVQLITAKSLVHRMRYVLRTQACWVASLIVGFFILISILSWQQPVNPSGWGCDAKMFPAHASNRVVNTVFCQKHDPVTYSNSKVLSTFDSQGMDPVRFMVIGDFGRDGYCCQLDVAHEMSRCALAVQPNFVVNVGDAFYTHGLLSPQEEQVKTSFENVYLQYDNLHVPWFSALGNHEYRGSAEAVLELSRNFSEYFTMEARFWDRTVQTASTRVHLFFLDTTPMIAAYRTAGYDEDGNDSMLNQPDGFLTQNVSQQLEWFERRLELSALENEVRIVVGHHPPFTSGSHHGEDDKFLRHTLSPLLEKYKVSAYIGGHDHSSQEYLNQDVYYFVSGAGSMTDGEFSQGDENLRFFSEQNGFLAVDVTPAQITVCFVNTVGEVLRTTRIPL